MGYATSKVGTKIFYKDWGTGSPVVFSHGWPQVSAIRRRPGEVHNETVVDAGSAEPLRPTAVSPSRRRPGQPGFV